MMLDFADAVEKLEKTEDHSATCVVLAGEGGFFCSGADLGAARSALSTPMAGSLMCRFMQHWTTRFQYLPLITVAAIAGGAVGGGSELATACDHRVMSSDSHWCMIHARHGLTPGWGGATRVREIVGHQTALTLLAGAERHDAEECLSIGLCDAVLDPDEAAGSTTSVAAGVSFLHDKGYLQWEPHTTRAAKQLVMAGVDSSHQAGSLAKERALFEALWPPPILTQPEA